MGSLIAVGFYQFVKLMEYNTVNPDCDHDGQPKHTCRSCRYGSDSESDDAKSETMPTRDASNMA